MTEFNYSKHAVERLKERFPHLLQPGMPPKVILHRLMSKATRERGFMNDTRRIVWMLEKYGDWNYDYYVNGDVVLLTREGVVITLINRGDMGMSKLLGAKAQPRFRKKTVPA